MGENIMDFRSELTFDTENGMPHSADEMNRAMESNWIHPSFRDGVLTVDRLLDNVDVVLDWYIPSADAFDFMNFIRLVLGEEPENDNPIAHYFLIDCIFRSPNVLPYFKVRNINFSELDDRILVLCTREFAKSVLIGTMLVLYMAAKGKLPGFGSVNYVLYVSDSMRNNVKTTMETIGSVYLESEYLRGIFESATTNQDEISFVRNPATKKEISVYNEFVNKRGMKPHEVPGRMKRTFAMKGLGAATGGRGSRDSLFRPEIAIFDDMIGNEADANSDIILGNIESTIESDVLKALSGNGNLALLIGTPYNKKDPLYKRIEDGSWAPVVFPKAEVMDKDTTEETFRGVWPDRHSFKQCRRDFMKAQKAQDNGNRAPMRSLMQEYYLRISSNEDRLIAESMIQWTSRTEIMKNSWNFNWYLTTDYTTTGSKGSDYSGAALWAVDSNQNFFLIDLVLKQMELEPQYQNTFDMVMQVADRVRWVEVGVELDGGQGVHILALKDRMPKNNYYFSFAKQKGGKEGQVGIRSRLEGGNKHWRFQMGLPYWQNHKVWLAEELKYTPDMMELLDELRYVTYSGFGSRHDDGADIISQLWMMDIQYPAPGSDYAPQKRVGKTKNAINAKIWGEDSYHDDEGTAFDSYA